MTVRTWRWRDVKPCGTLAAYRRHYRHGEQPCEACKKANARRWQDITGPARLNRQQAARHA